MRELVPGFENLNSRGARVDGGAFITLSPVLPEGKGLLPEGKGLRAVIHNMLLKSGKLVQKLERFGMPWIRLGLRGLERRWFR